MSDPLCTDPTRTLDVASDADREAKIEELLLVGLDHYFAAQHEQAINVWTRALFLDRTHAKARAYIERARSALAEGQRESEELVQSGVAAFQRGDASEARRLLETALSRGAPSEEALAVLDRLNRLEQGAALQRPPSPGRNGRSQDVADAIPVPRSMRTSWIIWVFALLVVGAITLVTMSPVDWRTFVQQQPSTPAVVAPRSEAGLPLPRRSELALARARALMAGGHLHEALAALNEVRPTDPERPSADDLRTKLQRQLLDLASIGNTLP